MTKVFLKTLDTFYYERMVASAPTDFTDMVNMGVRLEEDVREGRLVRESSSSNGAKRYGGFVKKHETNAVTYNRSRRVNYHHWHVAAVTPLINPVPPMQAQVPQQRTNRFQPGQRPPRTYFEPIPMTYSQLYPALIQKGLVTPRGYENPPPNPLPTWYDLHKHCAFHEGAAGHDLEGCFALKAKVRDLIKAGILNFQDIGPNVKTNPMPNYSGASTSMLDTNQ